MDSPYERQVKDIIGWVVAGRPGIRGTELVAHEEMVGLFRRVGTDCSGPDIARILDEMSRDKEIIELEYTTPDQDYRLKSIYFPKGTEIEVSGLSVATDPTTGRISITQQGD
jgi:hypothetical protein